MNKLILTILGFIFVSNSFSQNATKIVIQDEKLDGYPANFPLLVTIAAKDNNLLLDINYNQSVTVSLDSGSVGSLSGTLTQNFVNGLATFSDLKINTAGTYKLKFSSGSLQDDGSSSFVVSTNLPQNNGPTNSIQVYEITDTVGKYEYIYAWVVAYDANSKIDTTNNNSIEIKNITNATLLNGNTQVNLSKGIGFFYDISLSEMGSYELVCSLKNTSFNDTITVLVESNAQLNCDTNSYSDKNNLGLYGGTALDLHFSHNDRLFIGTQTPHSLFYSDDIGNTWTQAFPHDSLLFNCDLSGWAGGATKILSNTQGWIATHTVYQSFSSSQISFNNGDSGSFKTAIDGYSLSLMGYDNGDVACIALNDYQMISAIGSYIVITENSTFDPLKDIIDLKNYLSPIPSNLIIKRLALINTSNPLNFYTILDTLSQDINSTTNKLHYYNGSVLTEISIPSTLSAISNVFTHPAQLTADTLFITGYDNLNNALSYRSYDGGLSWTNISFANQLVTDIEYNSNWVSLLTQSNGAILIASNGGLTKDYGASWDTISATSTLSSIGVSVHPSDLNTIVGNNVSGALVSTAGAKGPYIKSGNEGLEAIQIKDVAKGNDKSFFYIATDAGLAYTTAYNNNSILPFDKWQSPYGVFPISNTEAVCAVAIDPTDSLHVVAGGQLGFYVSTNGTNGFSKIVPTGFSSGTAINDIKFINSSTLVAIRGERNTSNVYGELWRSVDGGLNWSNVSPPNFYRGMCLAVASSANDTIIYAGTLPASLDSGYLWYSTDLGINWSIVNAGPKSQLDSLITGMGIAGIAIYPGSIDTLYVVATKGQSSVFAKSIDGGLSYSILNSNELLGESKAVEIYDYNNDTILSSFGNDIFMYSDLSKKFTMIHNGLPGEEQNVLESGSVLSGSTVGFFVIDLEPFDDIITTFNQPPTQNQNFNVYPNPSSGECYVEFYLEEKANCTITIYDIYGKKVKELLSSSSLEKGNHMYPFSTSKLSSGIYFIKSTIGKTNYTVRVVKNG